MKNNLLIICDSDKNYCHKLDSYIRDNLSIPFSIYGITDITRLSEFTNSGKNILLLISQSLFEKKIPFGFKHILVLKEKENVLEEKESYYGYEDSDIRFIDKYQRSENITDSILSMCLDIPEIVVKGNGKDQSNSLTITGFYTPGYSKDKTAEVMDYAGKMAAKEKILYINTDSFCTSEILRNPEYNETIADLIYFAECSDDKFGIYLERIVKHDKELDFVPVCHIPSQGRMIKSSEYAKLFRKIAETEKYDTIVFDISDGMPDLFDALNLCDELYVIHDNDYISQKRVDLLINDLQRDEDFDMNKLHRVTGGGRIGA